MLPQQALLVTSHVPDVSDPSYRAVLSLKYTNYKALSEFAMRGFTPLVTPSVYHVWYTDVPMSSLINQLR